MPPRKKPTSKLAARKSTATKRQKMALGEKILEQLAAEEPSAKNEAKDEDIAETTETKPIPLTIEEGTPEQDQDERKTAAFDRLVNRWSQEEEKMNSSVIEAEEVELNEDKYAYTNYKSEIDATAPILKDGETPQDAINRLEALDASRPWRTKAEILQSFGFDIALTELSLAAALSEVGVGLESVGLDKYRIKIWEN